MTRGFALIDDDPSVDVRVMNPGVASVEQLTNIPLSALDRVRSIEGVGIAAPLAVGTGEVIYPSGRFQRFQVIGLDDATLTGAPAIEDGIPPSVMRSPDAVIVAAGGGGTSGKLDGVTRRADEWQRGAPRFDVPTRPLAAGDELLVNDRRVLVKGRANTLPRFPPRPLLYTTFSNAAGILLRERHRLTFVLAMAAPGIAPRELAARIQQGMGLRARTAPNFKSDTVRWYLATSEEVGGIAAMLTLAMSVGFGVTAVMLYMFTSDVSSSRRCSRP